MTIAIKKETESDHQPISEAKSHQKIGIPKEIFVGECRVAATPNTAKIPQKYGFEYNKSKIFEGSSDRLTRSWSSAVALM